MPGLRPQHAFKLPCHAGSHYRRLPTTRWFARWTRTCAARGWLHWITDRSAFAATYTGFCVARFAATVFVAGLVRLRLPFVHAAFRVRGCWPLLTPPTTWQHLRYACQQPDIGFLFNAPVAYDIRADTRRRGMGLRISILFAICRTAHRFPHFYRRDWRPRATACWTCQPPDYRSTPLSNTFLLFASSRLPLYLILDGLPFVLDLPV